MRRRNLFKWTGLSAWAVHMVLSRVGVYRCPRCRARLNFRWWCKRCQRYRLPRR